MRSFHWFDVRDRVTFKLVIIVHRCLSGRAPQYLPLSSQTSPFRTCHVTDSSRTAAPGLLPLLVRPPGTVFSDTVRNPNSTEAAFWCLPKKFLFMWCWRTQRIREVFQRSAIQLHTLTLTLTSHMLLLFGYREGDRLFDNYKLWLQQKNRRDLVDTADNEANRCAHNTFGDRNFCCGWNTVVFHRLYEHMISATQSSNDC